jgi:hypothetical protein
MPFDALVDLDRSRRAYLLMLLARFYPETMAQGLGSCPLDPIVDAILMRALAERGWLLSRDQVADVIGDEAARVPQDVRLLRERGRARSSVRLSDGWLRSAAGW